jgi:DnaK suppressor protein
MNHDDDLRATRAKLLGRGAELRDRLRRVHLDLTRSQEPLPGDSKDAAIVIENDEVLQAIEHAATRELADIERALERLDAGTFGVCEACGAEIAPERLRAVTCARRCSRCERAS